MQRMLDRASFLVESERLVEADQVYEAAAGLAEEKGLPPEKLAEALQGRISCLDALFDLVGLRDVSLRLLAVQERMKDPLAVAVTQTDLGYLQTALGNARQGVALLERAARTFEAKGEESHLAGARARLAYAYTATGRLGLALTHGEAAEAWYREKEDHAGLVEVLAQLGNIHRNLGDHERAGGFFLEGLSLLPDGEAAYRADFLANLGLMHLHENRLDLAAEKLGQARGVFEGIGDFGSAAVAAMALGILRREKGDHEGALALAREARELAKSSPVTSARARYHEAEALREQGREEAAGTLYETSLAEGEKMGDLTLTSSCLLSLALLDLSKDKADVALSRVRAALDGLEALTSGVSPLLQALGRGGQASAFEPALRVAFSQPDPAATLEILDRTRAATLRESLGDRFAPPTPSAELAKAKERLLAAKLVYEAASGSGHLPSIRESIEAYRTAQDAYRAALERSQRTAPGASVVAGARVATIEEVRKQLGAADAMVLYALAGERLKALVVRADGARAADLGPAEKVEAEVRSLREAIASGEKAVDGAALRKMIVDPLGLAKGTRRLLVSPDGPLATAPLALLAPDMEVALLPSATTYLLLRERKGAGGSHVLAVGDPSYAGRSAGAAWRAYAGGRPLLELPATRKEIEDITGKGDTRLLGGKATETAFRTALPKRKRWRAVHLACHGLVDRRRPAWSSLALTPDAEHDGFLTLLEVLGMRVEADLVVLSACETGLGRSIRGEGLFGLTSAFLHAGAPRVIASLWKVDDEATRAFMTAFYARWNEGAGAAAALRGAREHVRSQVAWKHPRYWAAWVLWGLPD
ncbi:MAG: CHAT domain-containing protein [Planctomycetota bacterium]